MTQFQLALALTGGGARAAYQVGSLRYIARHFSHVHPTILTGVSAGAINAAHIANSPHGFAPTIERLRDLWLSLNTEQVYRVDARSLFGHMGGWGARLLAGGRPVAPQLRGMVDTMPLRRFLAEHLAHTDDGRLATVQRNIDDARIHALAISTTSYATGQSITYVQGREMPLWSRPQRRTLPAQLTIEHVMASAALPMFFPAVHLGDGWHGDGGIRLTAPLSPALHLGATHILAVSPRFLRDEASINADRTQQYPSPARIAGVLMNAIFLDMLDHDVLQMNRINALLAAQPPEKRPADIRPVQVLVLRPSQDLGHLAADFEVQLPRLFRFMERGFGTREGRSADALALVMFEQAYLARLIELGEADAASRHADIERFLNATHD